MDQRIWPDIEVLKDCDDMHIIYCAREQPKNGGEVAYAKPVGGNNRRNGGKGRVGFFPVSADMELKGSCWVSGVCSNQPRYPS